MTYTERRCLWACELRAQIWSTFLPKGGLQLCTGTPPWSQLWEYYLAVTYVYSPLTLCIKKSLSTTKLRSPGCLLSVEEHLLVVGTRAGQLVSFKTTTGAVSSGPSLPLYRKPFFHTQLLEGALLLPKCHISLCSVSFCVNRVCSRLP